MNRLKTYPATWLTALGLILGASCISTSRAQTASASPVVGTWRWTLFSGKCTETLQYRRDGVLVGKSATAVTRWRYTASSSPDTQGFYKTDEISIRYNAKKDCSDDMVVETGLETVKFIQLNPAKDQMIVCKTPSLQACYGPLKRMP